MRATIATLAGLAAGAAAVTAWNWWRRHHGPVLELALTRRDDEMAVHMSTLMPDEEAAGFLITKGTAMLRENDWTYPMVRARFEEAITDLVNAEIGD